MIRIHDTHCPTEDDLLRLHDRALDAEDAARLEEHVRECDGCRATLASVERLDALIGSDVQLPHPLRRRLEALPQERGTRRLQLLAGLGAMAAAALVLLGLGIGKSSPRQDPEAPLLPTPALVAEAPSRLDTLRGHLLEPTDEGRAWIETGGTRLASALHRLVRDEDAATRRAALTWLREHPGRASLPVLVHAMKRGEDRALAIQAMQRLGDERAVATLELYLDDPEVGSAAMEAALALGGERAADLVLTRARAAEDEVERTTFVAALARISGPRAVENLIELTADTNLAADALAALRLRRAEATPHLLDLAAGHDPRAARQAVRVLAHLAPPEATPRLARLLDRRSLRQEAARTLLRIDTPEAAEALVRHGDTREIRTLFEGAGPGVEAWLASRLNPRDRTACRRHVDLLALCGGDLAVGALADLVEDSALAPAVVDALGQIGSVEAVRLLAPMAERSALRRLVVGALGDTGRREAVSPLRELGRRHRALRGAIRAALGAIDHPDAVRAIVELDGGATSPRAARRTLVAMDRTLVLETLHAMIEADGSPSAHRLLVSLRSTSTP